MRQFVGRGLGMLVGKIWVVPVRRERAGRQNLPAFHAEVILRAGERIVFAGFLDGAAGGEGRPERIGSAHSIGVETLVCTGVSRFFAAVSQREHNDSSSLALHTPR